MDYICSGMFFKSVLLSSMPRIFLMFFAVMVPMFGGMLRASAAVVADSVSRTSLPNVSILDRRGKVIGLCDESGSVPEISPESYPLTFRFLGFKDKTVYKPGNDTIFMAEDVIELNEVEIDTRHKKLIHLLAYVREYSSISTYSDTVFLFREKMVDFILPIDKKVRFKGWRTPRVLTSKSYYHFTNSNGLDSVSDHCNLHFSWADWMGITRGTHMPRGFFKSGNMADTIRGRYGLAEVWTKKDDRITLDVNVIADTTSRKWVPYLSMFFREGIDYEKFKVRYEFDNIVGDSISPVDLKAYSFNIESNGRGHGMFMFNREDEPFYVTTEAQVYILDREHITVKEAKKWEKLDTDENKFAIYEAADAPELSPEILSLIARVNSVDHEQLRLGLVPDHRLAGRFVAKQNFGNRLLQLFKDATGISRARATRKWNNNWNKFKKERIRRNNED